MSFDMWKVRLILICNAPWLSPRDWRRTAKWGGHWRKEKWSFSPVRTCVAKRVIPVRRRPHHDCFSCALPLSGTVCKWNIGMQPQEQITGVTRFIEHTAKCQATISGSWSHTYWKQNRLCPISLSIQCICITRVWLPATKILQMVPGNKNAAISDPLSTSDVQYWHIRYPSRNVGPRFCWKTHEQSGR